MPEKLLLLYPAQKSHLARLKKIAPDWNIIATTDKVVAKKQIELATAVMGNHHLCESIPFNKKLAWVQTNSVGVDVILKKAGKYLKNKLFTNAKNVYTEEMCEHTIGLILLLQRNLHLLRDAQNEHRWQRPEHLGLLKSKNILILGYGSLGKSIGEKLLCFGSTVYGVDTTNQHFLVKAGKKNNTKHWKELLPITDILIVSLPFTKTTRNIIDKSVLTKLPKTAFVINVGRPETLDEAALIDLLQLQKISGAALDVFSSEPLKPSHPAWLVKNLFISPHCARSKETTPPFQFEKLFEENFKRYVNKQILLNLVDKKKGY